MDSVVIVGSCAGTFYALNRDNGGLIWNYHVYPDGASQFHGNPLVVDSLIVIGTDEGRKDRGTLYAFNVRTGQCVWKITGTTGAASDPAYDGGSLVYVVTREDSLLAVSLTTGISAWSFSTGWQRDPDLEHRSMIEIPRVVSSPLAGSGRVYFAGRDSTVYALDAGEGEVVWAVHFDNIITSAPMLVDGRLAVGLDDYTLTWIDGTTAEVVRKDTLDYLALGQMARFGEYVISLAGFEDSRPTEIQAIHRRTGEAVRLVSLDDSDPEAYWYVPRIHIRDDWLIVGSTHGLVAAYSATTGEAVWTYRTDSPVRSIGHSDGVIFVGCFDGRLLALRVQED